jgi:hypothetical protein
VALVATGAAPRADHLKAARHLAVALLRSHPTGAWGCTAGGPPQGGATGTGGAEAGTSRISIAALRSLYSLSALAGLRPVPQTASQNSPGGVFRVWSQRTRRLWTC